MLTGKRSDFFISLLFLFSFILVLKSKGDAELLYKNFMHAIQVACYHQNGYHRSCIQALFKNERFELNTAHVRLMFV